MPARSEDEYRRYIARRDENVARGLQWNFTSEHIVQSWAEEIQAVIQARGDVPSRAVFLDFACGSGGASLHLATLYPRETRPDVQFIGIDEDKSLQEWWSERLQAARDPRVQLRVESVYALASIPDGAVFTLTGMRFWDAIGLCTPQPIREDVTTELFDTFARVVQPGGYIALSETQEDLVDMQPHLFARGFEFVQRVGFGEVYTKAA